MITPVPSALQLLAEHMQATRQQVLGQEGVTPSVDNPEVLLWLMARLVTDKITNRFSPRRTALLFGIALRLLGTVRYLLRGSEALERELTVSCDLDFVADYFNQLREPEAADWPAPAAPQPTAESAIAEPAIDEPAASGQLVGIDLTETAWGDLDAGILSEGEELMLTGKCLSGEQQVHRREILIELLEVKVLLEARGHRLERSMLPMA